MIKEIKIGEPPKSDDLSKRKQEIILLLGMEVGHQAEVSTNNFTAWKTAFYSYKKVQKDGKEFKIKVKDENNFTIWRIK